ncbi:hypothetical protein SLEP1_g38176 [Rubroshorea leprosula]|uniref:ABC-2 type transporter transmembrane domain-containing protein n=1 Tax=Rubroshorea leprosula TaxID=152421 RepID=A0AAV5KXC1_9ROSI|nr:hypothetical protein SLEP1_g38176 [Rubroshorea leprosula]
MLELFGIRLGVVLVTRFILATIFWHVDNSPKGVQQRIGFFAFAVSTTFYTCAKAIQECYIFMRETDYNAYRRSLYIFAHSIISIPSLIVLSIFFAAITFWMVGVVGLASGLHGFLFFFFTIVASFWAGSSLVTFHSGVVSHIMFGFIVVVTILAYFVLFNGFIISRNRIHLYWIWFHYISLVKYSYEAVLQNEFDKPTKSFVKGVQMFDKTPFETTPTTVKLKLLQI